MSPRGVAIPEVSERLFRAAEQVLDRVGPSGLSGRAITRQAGCAIGLLYNHFGDLDSFLAAFVADRLRPLGEQATQLPGRAGQGAVADNLTDFALSRLESNVLQIVGLALSRPALLSRLRDARATGAAPINGAEAALRAYLDAERRLGRIAKDADTEALALALSGTIHQLLLTHRADGRDPARRMRRVVRTLTTTVTPGG